MERHHASYFWHQDNRFNQTGGYETGGEIPVQNFSPSSASSHGLVASNSAPRSANGSGEALLTRVSPSASTLAHSRPDGLEEAWLADDDVLAPDNFDLDESDSDPEKQSDSVARISMSFAASGIRFPVGESRYEHDWGPCQTRPGQLRQPGRGRGNHNSSVNRRQGLDVAIEQELAQLAKLRRKHQELLRQQFRTELGSDDSLLHAQCAQKGQYQQTQTPLQFEDASLLQPPHMNASSSAATPDGVWFGSGESMTWWPGGGEAINERIQREMSHQSPAPTSRCKWHDSASNVGRISEDGHVFTKTAGPKQHRLRDSGEVYELSTICMIHDSLLRCGARHRYIFKILDGEPSPADGAGFVFDTQVRRKPMKQILAIFVNQRGFICFRDRCEVTKLLVKVPPLTVGSNLIVDIDLDNQVVRFQVNAGFADVHFSEFSRPYGPAHFRSGFFCAVVTGNISVGLY